MVGKFSDFSSSLSSYFFFACLSFLLFVRAFLHLYCCYCCFSFIAKRIACSFSYSLILHWYIYTISANFVHFHLYIFVSAPFIRLNDSCTIYSYAYIFCCMAYSKNLKPIELNVVRFFFQCCFFLVWFSLLSAPNTFASDEFLHFILLLLLFTHGFCCCDCSLVGGLILCVFMCCLCFITTFSSQCDLQAYRIAARPNVAVHILYIIPMNG